MSAPELEAVLAHALAAARASGHSQQWIVRRPLAPAEAAIDPLGWFAASGAGAGERFYLELPSARRARVAAGSAEAFECAGPDRFARASRWLAELRARSHIAGSERDRAAEVVGGFAFAPGHVRTRGSAWEAFPDLRLWLPRLLVTRAADGAQLALVIRVQPDAETAALREELASAEREAAALAAAAATWSAAGEALPRPRIVRPSAGYRQLLAEALDAIAKGDVDKLVVARSLDVAGSRATTADVLRALREANPHSAVFAVAPAAPRGRGPVFAGATPELLARVSGRSVETHALAGSAGRGRTAEHDARARRALLASAKERREHAFVVAALREALAPLCDEIALDRQPHALRLSGLQHLETRVRGRIACGRNVGLLELAARLHPSPAVLGAPRAAAARWLSAHEGLDRGWYAGGVGALRADGDGELFVALRCALLHGERARLFAGAGIVAGSTPAAEARETRLKLRALLGALREASRARG